jgi:cell division septation protein DedD
MPDSIATVSIVGIIALVAIVAIVFGRGVRGAIGGQGTSIEVSPAVPDPASPRRGRQRPLVRPLIDEGSTREAVDPAGAGEVE